MFEYFKSLLTKGFFEIRKHLDDILILIDILMKGNLINAIIMLLDSKMPCFLRPQFVRQEIRERISLRFNTGESKESDYFELVERLIRSSLNNWWTSKYDSFQRMTNGIEK